MRKKIFVILITGIVILWAGKTSFAMMGMCDMGGGAKGHGGHAEAAETSPSAQMAVEEVGNKICPVTGEKITEEGKIGYEYKGKTYNLCCPACIDEFKKAPGKYANKIKGQESEQGNGQHQGHPH